MIIEIPQTEIKFDLRDEYPTDPIVIREIWEENVYRTENHHFSEGGTVVDIGANIGSFSIYAASKGSFVYAIEPEPNNLKALINNINLNNMNEKIKVVDVGISDFNGTAVINDMGGGSTILDDGMFGAEIKIITLDDFFEQHSIGTVDVLKIDTEGSELGTILGASEETLNKCKYIAVEFDIRTGYALGDMVKKLSETHHVQTMGSWERGGMIWGWVY